MPDTFIEDSWATHFGVNFLIPVRKYQHEKNSRFAAQRAVLRQLPKTGSIILVAHSLGSVLAVDLLLRLPENLHVDLLLTIGSPLAIKRIGHAGFETEFPYDRVGGWVNLYDSGDLVTIGRGVSRRFPAASDVAIQTGEAHDAVAYMSNSAAAALVGHTVFGHPGGEADRVVARRLHPAWQPLLLSFAYSTQLSSGAKGDAWLFKARVDAARHILAERTLADAEVKRQELTQDDAPRIDESPIGPGRYPGELDLLHRAADLVRDTWTDEALLSLAVGLAMSPPLHPFDIEISDERRHEALLNTLNRVRMRHGNVSDKEFAEAVREGVKVGKNAVKESGFPWGTVLIGGGLILLSLTGVGLAVAAPAGLAGAALLTGTLAAFGPGGMIGGLVTIATLTGVGAAATGIGVGVGAMEDPLVVERARRVAVDELAKMPIAVLRNTLAGVLAVVDAQRRLHLDSTADIVEELLVSGLDILRAEHALHQTIAPDRTVTNDLKKRLELVERALDWLQERQLKGNPWHDAKSDLADLPSTMKQTETPRPRPAEGHQSRRTITAG